jgi:DNA-binding response OmpR family regulator
MANILLLEPDRKLATNTKKYLEIRGHQVSAHNDLQAAIMRADSRPPDVVVLNLILAGRSATEFLYELRSYPDWQNLPVIILSQLAEHELHGYQSAFQQLGVKTCLYKPATTLQMLAQAIEAQPKVAV